MPALILTAIARTEAQTDVAPLIPQSHGVRELDRREASWSPRGKAVPIVNPRGKSMAVATRMRSEVRAAEKALIARGVKTPKRISAPSKTTRRMIAAPRQPARLTSGVK